MIRITRLNSAGVSVNPDYIEFMEETPDLVITFFSGRKIAVRESLAEVEKSILEYRQSIFRIAPLTEADGG